MEPSIDPFFERQYNARAAIPDHPQIFARWAEASARVRAEWPCALDVRYGKGKKQTLDVFLSQGPSRALFVYFHGGYWRSLDKSDFSFLAPALGEAGVTVAMVNYDLAPKVAVADIVEQARETVVWLLRNAGDYGAHPGKLFVAGHSAGAHLVAMLYVTDWNRVYSGLTPKVIKGGLAVSGIYDLAPLVETSMNADLRLTAEAARALSPVYMEPRVKAPLTVAVGGEESSEFRLQTELLMERWKENLQIEQVPMPGFHHLNVIEELGRKGSALHAAAIRLMGLDREEEKEKPEEEEGEWKDD
ncbi:MAG: alpha/beta hydrolase [Pseudomonadota bacterium]